MTVYTDARSQPGKKGAAGVDDRELFLREFGEYVIEAWEQTFSYMGHTTVRNISSGKSDTFPVIGRKRNASDHAPGEITLGGSIEHNEVEITVDPLLFDSAFIAEIDELLIHYELGRPYAKQLGESIAHVSNQRIAQTFILASRITTPAYTGGPTPSYAWDAAMKTDPAKLEDGIFAAREFISTNDIGGGSSLAFLPTRQVLLLSRYGVLDSKETTGSADRSEGSVGRVGGLGVKEVQGMPSTNVTTGLTKYRGNFTNTTGFVANEKAVGTLRRRGMRSSMVDQKDRFGTLLLASVVEGHGALRGECSFELATASR